MKKTEIIAKMNKYISLKEEQVVEKSIAINGVTFTNLRDCLTGLGKILEENFDKNYYILKISSGIANKNVAIILIIYSDDSISMFAYAKEGFINQHTADKAMDKVVDQIT